VLEKLGKVQDAEAHLQEAMMPRSLEWRRVASPCRPDMRQTGTVRPIGGGGRQSMPIRLTQVCS
jgi:hypothetical protein